VPPPKARKHGGDEDTIGPASRGPRVHPAAGNVRAAENAVGEVAQFGRAGAGREISADGALAQTNYLITKPHGEIGGTPDGRPRRIEPNDDASTRRSIEMEDSAAAVLARQGWRIKQNPTPAEVAQARRDTGDTGNPDSNPDYLIEGRVFDALSPTKPTKSPRNIWSEVEDKVIVKQQTQRVVVNLEDWRGDLAALRKQFADWPIDGLKEVKVITSNGEIFQIDLPSERQRA
jgi:hypothetical protein